MKYLALAAPAVFALAACGANSANFGGADTDFDELVNEAIALTDQVDSLDATVTLAGLSDTVSYNGVAVIADNFLTSDEGIIGDVAMSVNFDTATLSGNVDSFYSTPLDGELPEATGTGVAVPGALTLSAAGLDTAFLMDVDGNITLGGVGQTVTGSLPSGFLGDTGQLIIGAGTLDGSVSSPEMILSATSD